MSLSEIIFPEENPFYRIKVRQIFLWFVLFLFLVAIGYYLFFSAIAPLTKRNFNNDSDPIIEVITLIHLVLLLSAWLGRQCNLVGIDGKRLIGKIPKNYKWIKLIVLIAARSVFSIGIYRVSYYFISFFAYSWVENKLKFDFSNDSFSQDLSKTFSPILFSFLYFVAFLIIYVYFIFLIFGIVLHRWSTKWGIRRTIFYFCIFSGLLSILGRDFLLRLIFYIIIEMLLYLKTRTLILVGIAYIIDTIISLFWNYSGIIKYDLSLSLVEQLRDRVWIGVIFLAISTPILVRFIYQNWHRIDEPLPYFTNSSQ